MIDINDLRIKINRDYKSKVKRFEKMNKTKSLIAGDSMVAYFMKYSSWSLQGIPGDTTEGLLNRINLIQKLNPKIVIIHIGFNDFIFIDEKKRSTVLNLKKISEKLVGIKVYICTPIPIVESRIGDLKKIISNEKLSILRKEILDNFDPVDIIDLYPNFLQKSIENKNLYNEDGIHLNKNGYQIYKKIMELFYED